MDIKTLSHENLIDNINYKNLFEEVKYLKETNNNLQMTIHSYELKLTTLQEEIKNIHKRPIVSNEIADIKDSEEYIQLKNNYNSLDEEFSKQNSLISKLQIQLDGLKSNPQNIENTNKNSNDFLSEDINGKIQTALNNKQSYYDNIIKKKDEELFNFDEKFKGLNVIIEELTNNNNILLEKVNKLDKKSKNGKSNKIERNKIIDSISYYSIVNKKSEEFVASYTYKQIFFYVELREIIKKENHDVNVGIDNIIKYMVDYVKHKNGNKYYLRKKIDRCLYLYDKYEEKLVNWCFSISNIANMNKVEWEEWKIYFDDKINNYTSDSGSSVKTNNSVNIISTDGKSYIPMFFCINNDCNNQTPVEDIECQMCNC